MTEQPMQGGYRRPANPAPVSGPGAMSQRTDGQPARYMSGGQYGEGQELMEMQTSAPMSESRTSVPSVRPSRGRGQGNAAGGSAGLTGLFAPSERPNEPITAGMPFGAGPGQNLSTPPSRVAQLFQRIAAAATDDETGKMEYIANLLMSRGF
jgi:hypothetical protein